MERINLNTVGDNLMYLNDCETHEDFLALCVQVDCEGNAKHSGIVICYEERLQFFHFNGTVHFDELDIVNIPNDLYFKKITIFGNERILAFKAYCEILADEISPSYGFMFTDSFYNVDGTYYTESNLPDITTCVGFCINVIRGFLYNNSKYVEIDDWGSSTIDTLPIDFQYWLDSIEAQLELLSINASPEILEDIKNTSFKRISPSELTSSAFFEKLPIRKISIDGINPTLENILQVKHLVG